MIRAAVFVSAVWAAPAFAATGPFFSLGNTNFVVTIAFLIFIGAIVYFKAPQFAAKLIDGRIDIIRNQVERAAGLRAEAAESLKKAKEEAAESAEQALRIVEHAREDAKLQVEDAESRIREAGDRRIQAAVEQIASAEKAARSAIHSEAVDRAVEAAAREIASTMSESEQSRMTGQAMEEIRVNMR